MAHIHNKNKASESTLDHASKDKALFNTIVDDYVKKDTIEASRIARQRRLRATIASLPSLPPNPAMLEVGCAGGFSAQYLKDMYGTFVGVDYADTLIAYAATHNALPGVSFIASDIQNFLPEQKFDVIFMVGVLHHFDNLENKLKHIRTMLKPGGILVANEPQSSNIIVTLARRIRSKLDTSYSSDQIYFSPKELQTNFAQAGFQEIGMHPQGIFSTPFAEVNLSPSWLATPTAHIAVVCDALLESLMPRIVMSISWNIIVFGKAPL